MQEDIMGLLYWEIFMESISAVGIDLSKRFFQVHAVNHVGRALLRKKVSREKLQTIVGGFPQGTKVYLEAGRASHYWAKVLSRSGVVVKQINAKFVKPYVKSSKNDRNDAEGILEAGLRPSMRFVSTKTDGQLEIQALHRAREIAVRQRTATMNAVRSLLAEWGVELAIGPASLRRYVREKFREDPNISPIVRRTLDRLLELVSAQEQTISGIESELENRAKLCPLIQRVASIPGIGILTASALVCACGDHKSFKNGRQFAAWLGLVPRQHSTGGSTKLLGLSKRGDVYVRKLLIHGARTIIRHALKKNDKHSLWIQKLHSKKGTNLAAVAVANKHARVAWRLLASPGTTFDPALSH